MRGGTLRSTSGVFIMTTHCTETWKIQLSPGIYRQATKTSRRYTACKTVAKAKRKSSKLRPHIFRTPSRDPLYPPRDRIAISNPKSNAFLILLRTRCLVSHVAHAIHFGKKTHPRSLKTLVRIDNEVRLHRQRRRSRRGVRLVRRNHELTGASQGCLAAELNQRSFLERRRRGEIWSWWSELMPRWCWRT